MEEGMLKQLEMIVNGVNPQCAPAIDKFTDKAFLLNFQEDALRRIKSHESVNQVKNSNVTENCQNLSAKSPNLNFNSAKPVSISDLAKNANIKMLKKYFLCRNITPAYKTKSLVTIVDDPEGKSAVRLRILNFQHSASDIHKLLPVGQLLAIKDPLFTSDTLDNTFTLKVDQPKCVIFISEETLENNFPGLKWKGSISTQYKSKVQCGAAKERILWKSVEEWKNEGNRFFVQKKFKEAVNCYTEGLKESSCNVDVCSNRSAAYINLGYFHRGLEDAENVLEIEQNHTKAIFRKTKCLAELNRCEEATSFLNGKMSEFEKLKNVQELVNLKQKLKKSELECKTGKYDVPALYQNPMVACNEVGEYFGPVKVEDIPGKGRGLIAIEDIPAGKLIIASKAFAIVYPGEINSNQGVKEDNKIGNINSGHKQLVQKVAEKLMIEPEHRKQCYHLWAGPELNPLEKDEEFDKIDMKRIDLVCRYNGFGGHCDVNVKGESVDSSVSRKSNGIWITPSYMNHSCWDCNSFWIIFGNLMMIRAFKNIQKGDEILMPYVNPQDIYQIRTKTFEKHHFLCSCSLCDLDSKDSEAIYQQRKIILQDIASCPPENIQNLKILIEKLENIRPDNDVFNVTAVFPYRQLGECYFNQGQFKNAIEALAKGHKIIQNSPMVHFAVNYSMNIVWALLYTNCKKKGLHPWIDILKKDLFTAYGCLSILKVQDKDIVEALLKHGITFEDEK